MRGTEQACRLGFGAEHQGQVLGKLLGQVLTPKCKVTSLPHGDEAQHALMASSVSARHGAVRDVVCRHPAPRMLFPRLFRHTVKRLVEEEPGRRYFNECYKCLSRLSVLNEKLTLAAGYTRGGGWRRQLGCLREGGQSCQHALQLGKA